MRLATLLLLLASPALAAPLVIRGGEVHTGDGVLRDGVIVIEGGRIVRVGEGLDSPAGAQVIDAQGAVVTAGLFEPQTQLGITEVELEGATHDDHSGDERLRAAFRVVDGYNPASLVIPVTRLEGVTSAAVVPSGGLLAGQSAWVDLAGATVADALVRAPLALHVNLAPGDGRQGGHATAFLRLREALDDARTFVVKRDAWERNQSRPLAPSRLDLEALSLTLGGRLPVVFHVERAADIVAVVNLAREQRLRPIIAGGSEAWRVATLLATHKVPVIVHPLLPGPTSFDTLGARPDNASLLHAAGVKILLSTGETHNARKLRQVAGNAVRSGLPHAAALAAITHHGAEAFGIERVGRLAPGHVANVVVWSGDPLELSTTVRTLVIRGEVIPLRSRQRELLERYRELPR